MRLCTFEVETVLGSFSRLGAATEHGFVDLHSACIWHLYEQGERQPGRIAQAIVPPDMIRFLQGGETSRTFAGKSLSHLLGKGTAMRDMKGPGGERLVFQSGEVLLRAPLPHPPSVRDFYAFEQHVKTGFEKRGEPMPKEWYEIPVYYKSAHWSIVGPGEEVLWPAFTEKFDYELELAAVIGSPGRNIPESSAREYIAGYTIMNDFSARDMQRKEMKVRLGPAKGKDFATGLGPVIVTPDELGDPYSLNMTARVNGETWSKGNSGSIHYSFEQMIAFASLDETLQPGDVIGSGTVGGGCGLELDRWVKPGDIIELEIEKIGVLRNTVVRREH
jgi:2-keto-4-pentenoate hydratase/2-oxohepta-3-ene-1,7-dioic acid hydratase in catechol pathway